MSSSLFDECCKKRLYPNVPPGTVIMDNVRSYSSQTVRIPNASTRNTEIIYFLNSTLVENINCSKTYTADKMAIFFISLI